MRYAVVEVNGSQFRLQEQDKLEVSKISQKEGEMIVLDKVLLFVDGSKLKIGKPVLEGIKVEAKILKNFLGEKLSIFKFKAKTGYRRKTGFRPQRTLLSIEKIIV